jgi:predicted nuclease of predicted toxin-antitoxin system
MNLSPLWVGFLIGQGVKAVHWSTVGDAKAPDTALMHWARENGHLVLTHDLDFSALIALAGLSGPSVVHVRSQGLLPAQIGTVVLDVLRAHHEPLASGAIVTIDDAAARVRILPVRRVNTDTK